MHLYLLQSPLQVINAFEASRCLGASESTTYKAVIFERNVAETNRLVFNSVEYLGIDCLRTVKYSPRSAGKVFQWLLLSRRLKTLRNVTRVYIGDYSAGMPVAAANLFPHAEKFLLDDGTSTLNFPDFRYRGWRPEDLTSSKNIPWLQYTTDLPDKLTVFSIYDVPLSGGDRLLPNRLSFLREKFQYDVCGPAYFIGTCLADVGGMDQGIFIDHLERAFKWIQKQRRQIIYFPHRREDLSYKTSLFSRYGVETCQPDLPFELYLASSPERPSQISGFYSTVFDTLRLMAPGDSQRLQAFYLPSEDFTSSEHRGIARASYLNYQAQDSEVLLVANYFQ